MDFLLLISFFNINQSIFLLHRNGNFAVKRTAGRFNRTASDQTIEQTINRDQKCHGGITGYSTTAGTVQRWVLTSHTFAQCQQQLEEHLHIDSSPVRTKDLGPDRMKFDTECVTRVLDILRSMGNPFIERESLVNLCSGLEAPADVTNDLLNAEQLGSAAAFKFSEENAFYSPIKKQNLKTFKSMVVKKTLNSSGKSFSIAAERSLFGRLLIIAQSRTSLSMKDVLTFSLSPIPWALGTADGGLVKTQKSKLIGKLHF